MPADACHIETTARPARRPAPGGGLRCAERAGHDGARRPTHYGPSRRRADDRAEAGGFTSASCAGHGAFSVGSSCATDKTGQLASGRAERSASSTGGARKARGRARFR